MKSLLIAFLLLSHMCFAVEHSNGAWLGTFANKKLTASFNYWMEAQVRYSLEQGNASQILYRTGFLQKVNQHTGLGYLYAFIHSNGNKEHRLTIQHTQNYEKFAGFNFSHRARFENRFLEEDTQSYEAAGRARYLLRLDQIDYIKYAIVIWNEIFINLNETSWNGNDMQDRNRFFIGLKRTFFDSNRFEFGYLNQFIPRGSGDISEHIATFYFFF